MPPKADYWKHFKVVGVVAYCLVTECQQPNISLGALPKPGEKKRLRKQISYDFFKANFILILLTPLPFICVLDVGDHTAPQPCQPDRLGTLSFLLDYSYCDRD